MGTSRIQALAAAAESGWCELGRWTDTAGREEPSGPMGRLAGGRDGENVVADAVTAPRGFGRLQYMMRSGSRGFHDGMEYCYAMEKLEYSGTV